MNMIVRVRIYNKKGELWCDYLLNPLSVVDLHFLVGDDGRMYVHPYGWIEKPFTVQITFEPVGASSASK